MLAVKRLATSIERWKARRARHNVAKTPHQKAQLIAMYLLGSVLLGWILLHTPSRIQATHLGFAQPLVSAQTRSSEAGAGGRGAGGAATDPATPSAVADVCNPFDSTCFANALASWAAGSLLGAFSPLTDGILTDPADIIFQSPPTDSYGNAVVIDFNAVFVGVLDVALACMLLIGAYNVMWGHHLSAQHTSITELIPRAILVVGAVHFNLVFLGMFIDFANELSLAVYHAASYHMVTDSIQSLLEGKGLEGLMLFLLIIVLGIMMVCLLIQRVGTIALIALLVIIAPLGLGCFLLPQTMRWGRLWLSLLSSALITQVLQVTALGLGGAFITTVGTTSLFHLDQGLANAFLAIGTLFLVLKIPSMLQTWALHPAAGGSTSSTESSSTATESSDVANSSTSTSSLTGGDSVSMTSLGGAEGSTAAAGAGAGAGGTEAVAAAAVLV